jgi:RNA polymerase sigma-70 factor (ECF subfamily)
MVRNPALAEDLLQEIFLKFWKSVGALDENVASLQPWLFAVARNHVLDYLKSGQNREAMKAAQLDSHEQFPQASLPEYDFVFEERVQLLRRGVESLAAREKRFLELAYFEGLTQTEMAAALNLPLGTVKTCIRAALRHLKEYLEKESSE